MTEKMVVCTRCHRKRRAKFMILRKVYNGNVRMRCRAKSVCASQGKRLRRAQDKN